MTTERASVTELQREVAEVWAQVLQIGTPSPDDNFVDLGGHSILAVRVLFELRERLGAAPALAELFDAEDLAEFAARVERAVTESRVASETVR